MYTWLASFRGWLAPRRLRVNGRRKTKNGLPQRADYAHEGDVTKHARTDRATYAPFSGVGWRGWTLVSIRKSLRARSVRYGVS